MQVLIEHVIEGCILSEAVYSKTNKPIMQKKQVLAMEHLDVLKAFQIPSIQVEKTLITGEVFKPIEANDKNTDWIYLRAVKDYKELFKNWQSGMPIDISRVRNIIIPLVEQYLQNTNKVFTLHRQSTKAEYLYHHSVAVGVISACIAKKMGYHSGDIMQVAIAGVLSDCGMAKIDSRIFKKSTALTEAEYKEITKHSTYSFQMVKKIPALKEEAKLAILQHHERVDGSGYPLGLTAEQVHPFSKIVALADVYHAMVSERLYRAKQSPFKVLEQIMRDSFGKFDLKAIDVLTSGMANFSVGTKVKLSNGQYGEVIFVEQKNPTRPMIKLDQSDKIIHLVTNRDLFIEELLNIE